MTASGSLRAMVSLPRLPKKRLEPALGGTATSGIDRILLLRTPRDCRLAAPLFRMDRLRSDLFV
jgi:hypothetical protein